MTTALGVCQLRLGNAGLAVDVFRGLVLGAGGIHLRRDVPAVFKANYATALLAAGNVEGGMSALAELRDETHPAVERIRDAVRQWKAGLTFWQRIRWHLGGAPARPVALNFPLGDLE